MRSFDLKIVGSTALVAVFAFAAAGDVNAQKHRGKNNHADRGNRAKAVKMQRQNRRAGRSDRSAGRSRHSVQRSAPQARNNRQRQSSAAVRQARRNDHYGRNRGSQRRAVTRDQPRHINVSARQAQHNSRRGQINNRRNDNLRRDRERREVQVRRNRSNDRRAEYRRNDRRAEYRRNDRGHRSPQIIVPTQKRYPERYRTQRRSNMWENSAWRNNRNRQRREDYYAPLRNARSRRDHNRRDRYDRRDRRRDRSYDSYGWNSPALSRRARRGMHNRTRNILASYYRMERHDRWKAYKRQQKARERYWRQVRRNERRYQRYLARVYRDRYYSQPYYYQPYTTVRYGYVTRPRRIYYPATYTVYNSYPSGYYYADDDYYDPYYGRSYYDPYYYDDDDGIDWTSVILQTALSAILPNSGFDTIVPVNNYVYQPSYGYTPASYSYAARPYYTSYSPTVYPASVVENAYQRGYQEGFVAGQNSAYYNDPYVMRNGSYYPYSVSLSRQRELLSEGYQRGYMDAMNGTGGYYYDDGYAGGNDLVGIMLNNVLTLS